MGGTKRKNLCWDQSRGGITRVGGKKESNKDPTLNKRNFSRILKQKGKKYKVS